MSIPFRRLSDHACIDGLATAQRIGAMCQPIEWPWQEALRAASRRLAHYLATEALRGRLSRRRARRLAVSLYGETRAGFGARLRGPTVSVSVQSYPQGGHHVPYSAGAIGGEAYSAVGSDLLGGAR